MLTCDITQDFKIISSFPSYVDLLPGNIRQAGGYHTNTADALRYMRNNVLASGDNPTGSGWNGHSRANVTKVGIVISDGLSDNRTATALEAQRTKDGGIHLFAVGVGKDVDVEELDAIAGQPSLYYRFLVENFEGLGNIRELMAIKTCTGEVHTSSVHVRFTRVRYTCEVHMSEVHVRFT